MAVAAAAPALEPYRCGVDKRGYINDGQACEVLRLSREAGEAAEGRQGGAQAAQGTSAQQGHDR